MSNSSILLIDWTLSGATTPGQSEPGSDDKALCIPISSSINGASSADTTANSLVLSYPTAEMQSVYSTAPADLAL